MSPPASRLGAVGKCVNFGQLPLPADAARGPGRRATAARTEKSSNIRDSSTSPRTPEERRWPGGGLGALERSGGPRDGRVLQKCGASSSASCWTATSAYWMVAPRRLVVAAQRRSILGRGGTSCSTDHGPDRVLFVLTERILVWCMWRYRIARRTARCLLPQHGNHLSWRIAVGRRCRR